MSHAPESELASVGEIMETWKQERTSKQLTEFVLRQLARNDTELEI